MKTEKYIVEIEMPDGDGASSSWVCDTLQSECDIEDEGRWKIAVKEYWKPSDKQMEVLWKYAEQNNYDGFILTSLHEQLKKLREE